METLWLGYDGLTVPYNEFVAILFYQEALDARIAQSYGHVPRGIHAVVVVTGGGYLPSRWGIEHLRRCWAHWRLQQDGTANSVLQ